ncbi:NUDIX domain-containing protein [Mucilaginibacter mali]|uniref:NUDIX domain-containing protein n=1 Tax=Mucilaginibacter mali TaxID=2740462 RepID=A0A7D4UCN7_9SPHI|nr:NUDIX domain-containing protein [Mucilaginibacter mali]QKJ29539.1 NUDIX domain-containing protein [Mucilaginibacter mali]
MAQKYRIYINEKVLLITSVQPNHPENFQKLDNQFFDFKTIYAQVTNQHKYKRFFILCDDAKAFLKKVVKTAFVIEASGGLVKNSAGDYLFIYRNDKWDLPKGKLEKGEKKKEGGVREVEEECGITVSKAGKKIISTYHTYISKGEIVLKKTYWYSMKYKGSEKLKPQLEEGITDVQWFNKSHMDEIKSNTFPSIMDVLEKVDLLKDTAKPLKG